MEFYELSFCTHIVILCCMVFRIDQYWKAIYYDLNEFEALHFGKEFRIRVRRKSCIEQVNTRSIHNPDIPAPLHISLPTLTLTLSKP